MFKLNEEIWHFLHKLVIMEAIMKSSITLNQYIFRPMLLLNSEFALKNLWHGIWNVQFWKNDFGVIILEGAKISHFGFWPIKIVPGPKSQYLPPECLKILYFTIWNYQKSFPKNWSRDLRVAPLLYKGDIYNENTLSGSEP